MKKRPNPWIFSAKIKVTIFLKSKKRCPKNDFSKSGPQTSKPFSTSVCFYESQPLDKDSSRSCEGRDCTTQVNQGLTKKDRLPDCWCRRSSLFFVLCSMTFHLKIRHCYFLIIQVENSFQLMSQFMFIFVSWNFIHHYAYVFFSSCWMMIESGIRVSHKPFQTVSGYLLLCPRRNLYKQFQIVSVSVR